MSPVRRIPRPSTRQAALSVAVLIAANLPILRSWALHFGATEAELDAELAGDDLIEHANLVATRAVTIDALPDEVWRWVVQLGQGRGGFYSYDWLENAFGCDVHSADAVEERWQALSPGDAVHLHPRVALEVVEAVPDRSLVLRSVQTPEGPPPPYHYTWAFVLRRARGGATRLVVRERYTYSSGWSAAVAEPTCAVSFVMTEKMLRGIRERAERTI
ncbi:MAG: SRPBCC family protein [Actinobacteria bacterium]|nr:SRPBCC family protein [Actinomycetota bacterium]MCG2802970.1 SRPBCC family protein [Cellulomonas sp.]